MDEEAHDVTQHQKKHEPPVFGAAGATGKVGLLGQAGLVGFGKAHGVVALVVDGIDIL
jgi:hypothetical protein